MKLKQALILLLVLMLALLPVQDTLAKTGKKAAAQTIGETGASSADPAGTEQKESPDSQPEAGPEQPSSSGVMYAKKVIKLYKAKKTSAKVLDKIAKGEAVTVITSGKTWSEVTYMGQNGYVKTANLSETAPEPTAAPDPTPAPEKGKPTVPASKANTFYTKSEADITVSAADIITAFVIDYYQLGSGYYNRIAGQVSNNLTGLLQSAPVIPSSLSEYEDILTAVCSDLSGGMSLELMGKQLNGKMTKTTSIFSDSDEILAAASAAKDEQGATAFNFGQFTVKSVDRGTYYLQLSVQMSAAPNLKRLYKDKQELIVRYPVKIVKMSGGGGGGGGGSGEKQAPVARLIVDSVRTEPELPQAGEEFDVILSLRNTSETMYLRNLQITFTSDDDALTPVDGTNVIYVDHIDAGSNYELRLNVRAKADMETSSARLELAADFEDKKLNALSASQSLVIPVQQVQRIELDTPTLPTGTTVAGDSYDVKMGIFNTGKTMLYNVTVKAVPEDSEKVATGTSYYIGNMDPGSSKTAELELIPLEGGTFNANLEVTFETVDGKQTTEARPITFSAEEEESYDSYEDYTDYTQEYMDEPQPPTVNEIIAQLPWQIYALAGGLMLILVVWIGIAVHRRRMRALEDDEME